MGLRSQAFWGAAVWWIVASGTPAGAQETGAPTELRESGPPAATQDAATARALFEEGLGYVREEKWELAADRFRRVVEIKPSHVAAYNLASALARTGSIVESVRILKEIDRDGTAPEDVRRAARQLLAEVEPRVGSLTIRVVGDTTGHEILLNEEVLGPATLVRFRDVDPGAYMVSLKRGPDVVAVRRVVVGGGQPLEVEVKFDLDATAAVVAPDEEDEQDSGGGGISLGPWWLWAGAGAVALATVGVVVLVNERPDADPVGGNTDPPVVRGVVQGTMP